MLLLVPSTDKGASCDAPELAINTRPNITNTAQRGAIMTCAAGEVRRGGKHYRGRCFCSATEGEVNELFHIS